MTSMILAIALSAPGDVVHTAQQRDTLSAGQLANLAAALGPSVNPASLLHASCKIVGEERILTCEYEERSTGAAASHMAAVAAGKRLNRGSCTQGQGDSFTCRHRVKLPTLPEAARTALEGLAASKFGVQAADLRTVRAWKHTPCVPDDPTTPQNEAHCDPPVWSLRVVSQTSVSPVDFMTRWVAGEAISFSGLEP